MPTYRSITTSIISQHGIYSLPEYPPPAVPNDPFSTLPTLCDQERGLVSVYIPSYPSSQFWIRYSIAPPYPPKVLYYFKLFLKGTCVVSWGCGEEDGYEGRTMFGLYDSGNRWMGETGIERRVLCFSKGEKSGEDTAVDHDDVMEIKIYRAKGRMRIKPRLDEFRDLLGAAENVKCPKSNSLGGISLVSAGLLGQREPQRFYKYALLDPLDKPFATFHYYNRTWGQLGAMGLIPPPKNVPSVPSSEPADRTDSPAGSQKTIASDQTVSSSSSSSAKSLEHTLVPQTTSSSSSATTPQQPIIPRATPATVSPPKWAIFAPKLGRSTSEGSPKKGNRAIPAGPRNPNIGRAITAPSLLSLSTPHNPPVTQAKFASLVRRARTPSPPKPVSKLSSDNGQLLSVAFGQQILTLTSNYAQDSPSRIPKPISGKSHSSRTTTPSPTKRTATRIPMPSPTKQEKILGRSLTPPAIPENTATDVPRSGSMGVLMTAVNSAMNRRRRIMVDGYDEPDFIPSPILPEETLKPAPNEVTSASADQAIDKGDSIVGSLLRESVEEIDLFDALEEGRRSADPAVSFQSIISKVEDDRDNAASNDGPGKGKASSYRCVSDSSSTKRRRWAIWGKKAAS